MENFQVPKIRVSEPIDHGRAQSHLKEIAKLLQSNKISMDELALPVNYRKMPELRRSIAVSQ